MPDGGNSRTRCHRRSRGAGWWSPPRRGAPPAPRARGPVREESHGHCGFHRPSDQTHLRAPAQRGQPHRGGEWLGNVVAISYNVVEENVHTKCVFVFSKISKFLSRVNGDALLKRCALKMSRVVHLCLEIGRVYVIFLVADYVIIFHNFIVFLVIQETQ